MFQETGRWPRCGRATGRASRPVGARPTPPRGSDGGRTPRMVRCCAVGPKRRRRATPPSRSGRPAARTGGHLTERFGRSIQEEDNWPSPPVLRSFWLARTVVEARYVMALPDRMGGRGSCLGWSVAFSVWSPGGAVYRARGWSGRRRVRGCGRDGWRFFGFERETVSHRPSSRQGVRGRSGLERCSTPRQSEASPSR